MDKEFSASLLRLIKDKGEIKLTRENFDQEEEIEKAVEDLIDFETLGYIEFCLPHSVNRSGWKIYDLVVAGGITFDGEDYLKEIG